MKNILLSGGLLLFIGLVSCDPDPVNPTPKDVSLTHIAYNPTSYTPPQPVDFPQLDVPADNRFTEEGIELGRRLFYDPILSADSTQSCSSCHKQSLAFTDGLAVSPGIDGIAGTRSSMALVNLGYNINGFFWDGRALTLEEQASDPIENPIELHDTWENVEDKLRRHSDYPTRFRQAFGIEKTSEITEELATKALAQFMRTLISYESKYDKALGFLPPPRPILTESEQRGKDKFFTENNQVGDAECVHCHGGRLFTDNLFRNNGLDSVDNVNNFADLGFGGVTGFNLDKGRFRVPTLRNIELTAPYMHDGRFATLEEVLDHYNEHLQNSPTLDPLLGARIDTGFQLTQQDKDDIIAFLKTLTDTTFTNNPAFSNPFQ